MRQQSPRFEYSSCVARLIYVTGAEKTCAFLLIVLPWDESSAEEF